MPGKITVFICVFMLCLLGCADPGADEGSTSVPVPATAASVGTLVPTFTPLPDTHLLATAVATPGLAPQAVDPTATIDFAQPVVQLEYEIPALGLKRSLIGNVSSQITVIDETIPLGIQRSNQASILLDLQRKLPEVELEPIPAGCESCVYFKYSLPLQEESREGWLQDPVTLASIENYMAALLGPHFPSGTVIGLRREASPYYPAHSLALMTDGRIYTWLATEPQVAEPYTSPFPFSDILANLPLTELFNMYAVNCPPEPIETLRIYTTDIPLDIKIRCPAYALPTLLLPLYGQLDQILAEKLATYDGPARPPTGLPLDAVLDYRRSDGNHLTLAQNGRVAIENSGQVIYTGTLTTTGIISLTTDLLNSGQLQLGLTTLTEEGLASSTPAANTPETSPASSPASYLLVRGPEGLWDGKFNERAVPILADLNELLDSLLAAPETAETATPTAELSPEPEDSQPTATPTPTSSP